MAGFKITFVYDASAVVAKPHGDEPEEVLGSSDKKKPRVATLSGHCLMVRGSIQGVPEVNWSFRDFRAHSRRLKNYEPGGDYPVELSYTAPAQKEPYEATVRGHREMVESHAEHFRELLAKTGIASSSETDGNIRVRMQGY